MNMLEGTGEEKEFSEIEEVYIYLQDDWGFTWDSGLQKWVQQA